eukprot:CAMPEP_0168786800 /NCGR_PEP_ID=MMETSP0725-20121227/11466_1 /TAXON_ID=265536 /ORGANISM="Amphiprora sp., Strain CCMP467" /LENGTH=276 /DNA_ID=CAMNT_0008836975 /DNA_START=184 /DNA_END=1014 /DNA_ORIENTATION=-
MPAKKRRIPQDEVDDEDDLGSVASEGSTDFKSKDKDVDETQKLRREKRLAMNRESARARRKRKKILIETLEKQVADLTTSNNKYRHRVEDLEKELSVSKQTIAMLSSKVQQETAPTLNGLKGNSLLDQSETNLGARQDQLANSERLIAQAQAADSLAARFAAAAPVKNTNDALNLSLQGHALLGGGANSVALAQASLLSDLTASNPTQALLLQSLSVPTANGSLENALAQQRLLNLQQQQIGSMNRPNAALSSSEASRAILLRQIMEQQELAMATK